MRLDFAVFFFILLGSLIIGSLAIYTERGLWRRITLFGFFSGFLLYSGVGIAYSEVPKYYLFYYFVFFFVFAISFWFFKVAFLGVSVHSGRTLNRVFSNIDSHHGWLLVIWVYVLLHLVYLVYPEFKLQLLLKPQMPDLTTAWMRSFEPQEMNILLKLTGYATILLTPFFYIALYRYRNRIRWVFLIVILLLYISYVTGSYMSRSTVLMFLGQIVIVLWVTRPHCRRAMIISVLVLMPLILGAFNLYSVIRIGGTVGEISILNSSLSLLESETSFPLRVGMPIIEGNMRINFADYIRWIVTLPIPKIFTGEITGARINYDISEILLGVHPGERGWYVVLPGLVAESLYIYGRYFFWLHSVFVAFLMAFVVRLIERTPQLLFFQAYVVILFAYVLNRAGIAALLPVIVNHYMLFYLYVFAVVFGLFRKRRNPVLLDKK